MSLATLYSRAQCGLEAPLVTVEVNLANGLPGMSIVGLPETAVRESKDRVRAAVTNSGYRFPNRKVTVNLAPADLPKEGGRFDLPIALGILIASGQLTNDAIRDYEFIGELSLGGNLRPVDGALLVALATRQGRRILLVPTLNARECAMVEDLDVRAADTLLGVCAALSGLEPLPRFRSPQIQLQTPAADFNEVSGQRHAKRALEIAAAGHHHLLLAGPPGSGKSMLAARLPGILPPMSQQEAMEAASIASLGPQGFRLESWGRRPFRDPHHTASGVALVGGGSAPKPGEITLAHQGVLFLDELPEFNRQVLEVLRQPLESGTISISRAARQVEFPARFQLIAAMNPCPCGYLGDESRASCHCSPEQITRYRNRISGPLLDRLDMFIQVRPVKKSAILDPDPDEESSGTVRKRVTQARKRSVQRNGCSNQLMDMVQIRKCCTLDTQGEALISRAMDKLNLSTRGYHRVLKVARTIADLDDSEPIATQHLSEALSLRAPF